MGHYDFGQLLPAKRDSGQLHADAAEASTKALRCLLPSEGELPARRVLAPAGAATTEQREQQAEEQREQRARAHHTLALIGLQVAGTGDRVARFLVTAAGLGAVHAVEPGRASYVTMRSVNTSAAKAAPGLEVTVAAAAVRAHEGTVLTVSAVTALSLAPVADPARIAVRTLAGDMVAGMPVATGWTAVATTLAVETGGARLVTFGSVPARFARQTAAFDDCARLLAFALATPTATAQAVEASGAWLATILAPVARIAGARAVHRVAATAEALTIAIAAGAERALATLAAAALLLAGRRVAGALVVAAAAPPACVAQAGACLWIASRSSAAVACAGALSTPPARLAPARAAPWVARAMLALASMLAARAPAARVTRTLSGHVLALSVRVATAPLLAVGAPELARALGVAVGTEVAVSAAALAWPHAHLVF